MVRLIRTSCLLRISSSLIPMKVRKRRSLTRMRAMAGSNRGMGFLGLSDQVSATVHAQRGAGDIGIIQQITQALVDHLGTGLDAQGGLGKRLALIGLIVAFVELDQRGGYAVDLDRWRQPGCERQGEV